jgi:hypothetical protein
MQEWDKEKRPEMSATSWKQEDIRCDLKEGFRAGDHKANGQIFCQVAESEGLDIVEGSAPSETEKETAHGVRAGNVGAPATLGSFAPPFEKDEKHRMMVIHLD